MKGPFTKLEMAKVADRVASFKATLSASPFAKLPRLDREKSYSPRVTGGTGEMVMSLAAFDAWEAALRRCRDYFPMAYAKILALDIRIFYGTPYGATDGKYMLINPDGIMRIMKQADPVGLIAFLQVHEALHALLGHSYRLKDCSDHTRANIAADYVINAMIENANRLGRARSGFTPFPMIEGGLLDEELSGNLSAEQLYRRLFKPNGTPEPGGDDDGDGSGGSQSGDDGAGSGSGESGGQTGDARGGADVNDGDADGGGSADGGSADDDDGQADTGGGSGSGNEGSGNGNPDTGTSGGPGSGSGPEGDNGLPGFVGTGAPDLLEPQAEGDKTREDIQRDIERSNERVILQDALNESNGIGDSGGGFGRAAMVQRAATDGLGWEECFKQWLTIRAADGNQRPYNAPVYASTGLVCSGRGKPTLEEFAVFLDSSGSVGDEMLARMMETTATAVEDLSFDLCHILSVDARIRSHVIFRPGDIVPCQLGGGGGTRFMPAFEWARDNIPGCPIVYLTDGLASDFRHLEERGAPFGAPVLWLTWQRDPEDYPFGDAVRVSL